MSRRARLARVRRWMALFGRRDMDALEQAVGELQQ